MQQGQSDSNVDSIITGVVAIFTAIGTWLISRTKASAEVNKAKADKEPDLQTQNIAWTQDLIEDRTTEVDRLRDQLEKEREHRYKCMEQIADMKVELATLRSEVAELRRLLAERGQRA